MGFTRGLLDTVKRRFGGGPGNAGDDLSATSPRRILVDANTQTFWSRGAIAPTTLVEVDADEEPPTRGRVADVLASQEGGDAAKARRPRGNPAFSEALFVELMRAQQYRRAFALLSPDCQRRWRSPEHFANAHPGDGVRQLRGVNVVSVRYLEEWLDPDQGTRHDQVAELEVEYSFGAGDRARAVRRSVHLVAVDGKWRSLCYPSEATAAAS